MQVNANAIVTKPQGEEKIQAFINLFKYSQQYYGQKTLDEFSFSMFYSPPPHADLIFQVKRIPERLLFVLCLSLFSSLSFA